jgi:hypothetical protein
MTYLILFPILHLIVTTVWALCLPDYALYIIPVTATGSWVWGVNLARRMYGN